jgi:membrane protease YdiL (CAAX protease family)
MAASTLKPKPSIVIVGIISLLLFLFLLSFIGSTPFLHLFGLEKTNATIFFISRLSYWLCLFLVWLYVAKVERQKLLLWQERNYKFTTAALSCIVIVLLLFVSMVLSHLITTLAHTNNKSEKLNEMIGFFIASKPLLVFTALTAGVVEELIFRGYLLPRLELLFKNSWVAIIVSSLLFGLLHYKYGTLANVVGPFFIGLVFACYYWKYRNIKILIFCHFVWDLFAIMTLIKTH